MNYNKAFYTRKRKRKSISRITETELVNLKKIIENKSSSYYLVLFKSFHSITFLFFVFKFT